VVYSLEGEEPHSTRLKMKTITLTQGYVARIDDEDYERVSQHTWAASVNEAGNVRAVAYVSSSKRIYMHRFILGVTNPKIEVDHKDNDGTNNQKYNLRIVTHKQNSENRKPRTNTATGIRNVYLRPSGRYYVRVMHNYAIYDLGTYDTIEEAAHVAANARRGRFTHSND
jgi:hypothetical protein